MNQEVKSAVRVLELIELLGSATGPMSLKQIVAELGYPKSSAHALAQTLVGRGYVLQDASERYVLADAVRGGLAGVSRDAHLIRLARPIMDELRSELGETVLLGVRDLRGNVRTIAKSVSDNPVRYDKDLGRSAAGYCTAMGRVLLAFWDENATEAYLARTPLVAHTPFTVTDIDRIRVILRDVRRAGVAISDQEYVLGSTGIAAPILDRHSRVAAVIDVGAISARFAARETEIVAGLRRASERLGQRLRSARPDG